MEIRIGGHTVEITKPDKVLFPDDGITKRDLAGYYERIAERFLVHSGARPVSMRRFPDGIDGESFFQKEVPDYFPDWIPRVTVEKAGGEVTMVVLDRPATLVYLANQACITPHVWLSRVDSLDRPDRVIWDLDPSPGSTFDDVRWAARRVRDALAETGLESFVMTSGSRGLHVWVPLGATAGFDDVRAFARGVSELLARRHPDRLTVETRKAARGSRVFLDYLRNGWAQTSAPPYSVRPRPGAPVAAPLEWDELGARGMGPRRYTIRNLFRRLGQRPDPWERMSGSAVSLEAAERRLAEMTG